MRHDTNPRTGALADDLPHPQVTVSANFQRMYSNHVSVDDGPYDIAITFGQTNVAPDGKQVTEQVFAVTITHEFAFKLITVLAPIVSTHLEYHASQYTAENDEEAAKLLEFAQLVSSR